MQRYRSWASGLRTKFDIYHGPIARFHQST